MKAVIDEALLFHFRYGYGHTVAFSLYGPMGMGNPSGIKSSHRQKTAIMKMIPPAMMPVLLWVEIKKAGQEWDKMTGKEQGATG